MIWKDKFQFLFDLFFPILCQRCGREGSYLCVECQQVIATPLQKCLVCDRVAFSGLTHNGCQKKTIAITGLLVATSYETKFIRKLIWQFKYNFVQDIAEILGIILVDFLITQNLKEYFAKCLIIPVPLHKSKLKQRGFNQAELLAEVVAKNLGLKLLTALKRHKNTKAQVELDQEERKKNVRQVFRLSDGAKLKNQLKNQRILLIDDVVTTGSTLNECAKVLRRAGAREIWALVVARN